MRRTAGSRRTIMRMLITLQGVVQKARIFAVMNHGPYVCANRPMYIYTPEWHNVFFEPRIRTNRIGLHVGQRKEIKETNYCLNLIKHEGHNYV